MSYRKRKSRFLPEALKRLAGLTAIDSKLDFGSGLSVASFSDACNTLEQKLGEYNVLLSNVDAARMGVDAAEETVRLIKDRMLKAVASRFGEDSEQYEKAGGKRTSQRKRVRKPAAAKAPTPDKPKT